MPKGRWRQYSKKIDDLERDLKVKEAEIKVLELHNVSIITANEQVTEYKKQLESVRLQLEIGQNKMSLLQEKLQRKRVELARKSVEIQFLRKERDSANLQAKIERERADMISRQLAAEATSHAVHMKEVQVNVSCNHVTNMPVTFPVYRCS